MMEPIKDVYYDLSKRFRVVCCFEFAIFLLHASTAGAVLIALPVMLAAWIEPIFCDNWLIDLGGHVWFDISVPACILLYYAIVVLFTPSHPLSKSV